MELSKAFVEIMSLTRASGVLSRFTVFDFSMGLVVPVVCVGTTVVVVVVTMLLGDEEIEKEDVDVDVEKWGAGKSEDCADEKMEEVQVFVDIDIAIDEGDVGGKNGSGIDGAGKT